MTTTSIEAYEHMRREGLLAGAQLEVYEGLARLGGLTRNELDQALSGGQPNPTFSRRLAEMERRGVVSRGKARECCVTGRKCEVWTAVPRAIPTARLPRAKPAAAGEVMLPLTASEQRRLSGVLKGLLPRVAFAREQRDFLIERAIPSLGAAVPGAGENLADLNVYALASAIAAKITAHPTCMLPATQDAFGRALALLGREAGELLGSHLSGVL